MKNRLVIVLCVLCFNWGFSQDEYTIAHSNYAPTKTFLLNPTNTLDNKVWLDIHLVGMGTFVHNDYVFLDKTDFSFYRNIIKGETWPEFQYNQGSDKKSGYQDSDIQLLSAAFQHKEHGFAFGVRARTLFDFRRITPEVAKLITEGPSAFANQFDQVYSANKMFMNQMAYGEFALSYSNMFYHREHKSMALGITGKYLLGITGAGVKIDEAEYNIQGETNADFINLNGAVGYATPSEGSISTGGGFAVDLGFVYKKTINDVTQYEPFSKTAGCEAYDYKYKLSASIIDLGYIRYRTEATKYEFETTLNSTTLSGDEFTFDGFGNFANENLSNVSESDKFIMLTPTALNLMADYNFENNFYASGQVMHGFFRVNSFGVKRPDVYALSGRYQRKWFEASTKLSLYDYEDVRLGLAFRLGYLTIGTDKLLSFFGVRDFYGADAYFNLRFFLEKRPGCGQKKKDRKVNSFGCVKN